jgi:hypothetical protein
MGELLRLSKGGGTIAGGFALGIALIAGALSMLRAGFNFNRNNNAFHIPIVLEFEQYAQFKADEFIHSLKGFVTPIFYFISLVCNENNIHDIFFYGTFLTHVLTIFSLLCLAASVGIRTFTDQFLLALIIVAARTSYWASPVGGDGMLIDAFTHSEIARVFFLLCCAALIADKIILAGLFAGLTFAVNIAFGIWILLIAAGFLAPQLWALGTTGRQRDAIRGLLAPVLAFAALALPATIWILSRAELGVATDFDYVEFLRGYYPKHFFIGPSLGWPLIQVVAATGAALIASRRLARGTESRRIIGLIAGLFILGIVIGETSRSRELLQLHFLRLDGSLMLLATALSGAALLRAGQSGGVLGLVGAGLGGLALILGIWPLVLLALLLAGTLAGEAMLRRALPGKLVVWATSRALVVAAGLGFAALCIGTNVAVYVQRTTPPLGVPDNIHLAGSSAVVPDWLDVQRWARAQTPEAAIFLLPASISDDFRVGARRRIWVGMKDGATAMWAPRTYRQWKQRADEVRGLGQDLPASLAYACAHGIDYAVIDLRPHGGRGSALASVVHRNRWFEVHRPPCAGI